jgi:diguanylate cyclase (GGDEF)-like protein
LAFDYDLLLLLHVASATMLAALLVFVVINRREPLAPWLAGVLGALLLWTVAYILELAAVGLASKLAWANLQLVSAATLPVFWLLAMRNAAAARPLPRWLTGLLWLSCLVIIACVYANPGHLFRGQPSLDRSGPIPFVAAHYGLLYYGLCLPFTYGLLGVALFTLGRAALHGPQLLRARSKLLILASLLPMAAGLLYVAGLLPWPNFNPAMSSLTLSALLCGLALVRYRLLDLTPLARETVIEQLADAIIVADDRGLLTDYNPAAQSVLPELSREALGRPLSELLAGRAELAEALRVARAEAEVAPPASAASPALAKGEQTVALVVGGANSSQAPETRHFGLRVTPVLRHTGLRLGEAIVLHDVTQGVRLYHDVRQLARTDELTGLLTRRRLLERGAQEVARARRGGRALAVLVLDLDHFKLVNDLHGHAAGDEVLRALGARCRAELRGFDLVGRYGGDEICAVLPELEEAAACVVAERLRAAIAGLAVWYEGTLIGITVSIGVAAAQVDGETTLGKLFKAADAALYQVKDGGRDRVAVALQKSHA